jgi:signal transduction histidine kinase
VRRRTVGTMREWVSRHPVVQDWVLAVVVTGAVVAIDVKKGDGEGIAAVAAIVVLAVLLRRRWPLAVLGVTTGFAVAEVVFHTQRGGFILALGVLTYSAALYSPRRQPWHCAAAVFGVVFAAGAVTHPADWLRPDSLGAFAWIFGGAGVGDSVRMRRAYIAEVTERARQAEQTREEEAQRRVIDERLRIARELHDVVAHHIAVISVQAGAAGHVLRNDPEKVWPVLAHIRDAADTVLDEIQSVIGVLRDPDEVDLEPAPGLDRLPDLLTGLRATGFRVAYEQVGPERRPAAVVDLAAYRIVQEALTNAHRYGDGAASLTIEYGPENIAVEVRNRVGAARGEQRAGSGFGLLGMRERAVAAHGMISTGVVGDGSFRVHAVLPVPTAAVTAGDGQREPV